MAKKNIFDLAGRVALITGGAGLLGKEHAHALATSGARVVLADIDAEAAEAAASKLNQIYRGRVWGAGVDVRDVEALEDLRKRVSRRWGNVGILVNNAAIDAKVGGKGLKESSRVENFPLEQWEREVSVGLTGAFLCARVFGGAMARAGGGVILNIASDLSVIAPDQRLYEKPGRAPDDQPVKPVTYSVIKTGLIGLTRYLATYWAKSGVRVNALSPGGIRAGQPDDFVKKIEQRIPQGKMARPDSYRGAVAFLCSDASAYMTGQNVVIDGGRSVW